MVYKTRSSALKGTKSKFYRAAVLQKLGAFCKKCGFSDERALQIDHIDGGKAGHCITRDYIYYQRILNDPDILTKFQILCANHNWIKRIENDENNLHRKIKEKQQYGECSECSLGQSRPGF